MGAHSGPKGVTDSLVLAIDAANLKTYPGDGGTVYDLSGNGNNAEIVNGFAIDYTNKGAFVFDGVNEWLNFGNVDLITSAFSIEAWFKGNTSQSGSYNSIISKDISGSFGTFAMTSDPNNNYIRFGYSGTTGQKEVNANGTSGATDIKANVWVHYCGVWDGTNTLNLYRNGSLINSTTGANGSLITGLASNLMVADRTASDGFFNGSISVIRIYSKGLSGDEVLQNYNAHKSRYGL